MTKLIPGGTASLNDPSSTVKGVYAVHPAATPKFDVANYGTTQARMYVDLPDQATAERVLAALPAVAQPYARAMLRPGGGGSAYIDMFIQGVNESLTEKVQVSEVLSDGFISYFFGQRAPTFSFNAILLNTQQDNWYDAWSILYSTLLRGSKMASTGYPVTIVYDTRRITGAILASNTSINSQLETQVSLNFSVLVTRVSIQQDTLTVPSNAGSVARSLQPALAGIAQTAVAAAAARATTTVSTVVALTETMAKLVVPINTAMSAATSIIRGGASAEVVSEATGVDANDENVAIPPVYTGDAEADSTLNFIGSAVSEVMAEYAASTRRLDGTVDTRSE